MALSIQLDEKRKKFFAVENGIECYISYEKPDDKTLDLQHTIVPKELGGRGYAAELAEYALNYARENGMKVIPTCSYIHAYFEKHPELMNLRK